MYFVILKLSLVPLRRPFNINRFPLPGERSNILKKKKKRLSFYPLALLSGNQSLLKQVSKIKNETESRKAEHDSF